MTISNKILGMCLAILVGCLNVGLNYWAKQSAIAANGFAGSFTTKEFLIAFAVGACSLAGLVSVYYMKMPLYRGILLMGATSIIGGTVFGLYTTGQKPAIPEGGLLILLARFYVWSWIKSLTAH